MKIPYRFTAREGFLLFLLYLPLYIGVSWVAAENTPMLLDNIMYRERYDAISLSSLPFGVEVVSAILMYLSSKLGFNYFQFVFLKSISWLWVVYRLYGLTRSRRVPACILLVSFLIPSFHDITTFLLRQSFALEFFILAATSRSRLARALFAVAMLFSQITSILWLPFLYLKPGLLVRRKLLMAVLLLAPVTMLTGFSLGSQVVEASGSLVGYAGIFAENIQTKVGFYNGGGGGVAGSEVSIKNMLAMLGSVLLLALAGPRLLGQIPQAILRVIDIQILAAILFFLMFGNLILSNRLGYAAYFIAGLFAALSIFAYWPKVRNYIVALSGGAR